MNSSLHELRRLRELVRYLQSAHKKEKIRIARELRDELGHSLASIKISLASLGSETGEAAALKLPPSVAANIHAMSRLLDLTIDLLRNIVTDLHPSVLDDLGLVAAIEWQVAEFGIRTGIECDFSSDEDY